MASERPKLILKTLQKIFAKHEAGTLTRDPFKTLVITVISQNTNEKNTSRAFEALSKSFKITPEVLANANSKDLQSYLRVAGLHRNKAKTIKNLSRTILKKYHANLKPILSMPVEEARTELMKIHGIGPKTADVVLLFCARQDTIPVDTHVNRVSKRLGLAPLIGDYETVRKALQGIYDSKEYMQVHLQFISLGRNYCKAKSPLCKECPIEMFCPSRDIWDKNQPTTQASRKVQKVKLRR